jgi:hypothetical protein
VRECPNPLDVATLVPIHRHHIALRPDDSEAAGLPQGDQAAVTFAMKPEKVKAVGSRDRELVQAIAFPKK